MVAQLTVPCVQNESNSTGIWLENGQLGMKIASSASVAILPFGNLMNLKGSGNWVFTVGTVDLSIVTKTWLHTVPTFYEYICIHAVFRIRMDPHGFVLNL
jgi:hypothetical protein